MKRILITFLILIVLGSCMNLKKVSAEEVENKPNDDYNVVAVDLNTGEKTVEEISNKVEQSLNKINEKGSLETKPYTPEFFSTENKKKGPMRVVIGSDERKEVENIRERPFSSIGYIDVTYQNGSKGGGTGVLIAPDMVLSAAHLFYTKGTNGEKLTAAHVYFTPGKYLENGEEKSICGGSWGKKFRIPNNWINKYDSDYDWAIMDISDKLGNTCGYEGIRWRKDLNVYKGAKVITSGYPYNNVNGTTPLGKKQYYCRGIINSATKNRLNVDVDVTNGDSGAPICDLNDTRYVLGVVSYDIHSNQLPININYATRVNDFMYTEIIDEMKKMGYNVNQ